MTGVDLGAMPGIARDIAQKIRNAGFPASQERARQMICLAEEVGELLKAWRRFHGWARKSGEWADVRDEMADVVITAFVTASVLDIDLSLAVARKVEDIYNRGWTDREMTGNGARD